MRFRTLSHSLLLFIGLLGCIAASDLRGGDGLHRSLRKYRNSTVSPEALDRLSRVDHLVHYFAGFSYFAPRHKVNPDFIRALILAESGGDPMAVSSENALGLGQILLPTGRSAGRELAESSTNFRYVSKKRLRDLSADDLFDPAINILITCYLVAKYNYRFGGKLDLVVSAWNAGEHTKSLQNGRHAPYEETENLIGKVNGYYVYLLRNKTYR